MEESLTLVTTKTEATAHTNETLRKEVLKARARWPLISYISEGRLTEQQTRKDIRNAVREKFKTPESQAKLEERAARHAQGFPEKARAKAHKDFIAAYLTGAEAFAIAVSEGSEKSAPPLAETLLAYESEFEKLYSETLEKNGTRSAALGIASQAYRFDVSVITDAFSVSNITAASPVEERARILDELATTRHPKKDSLLSKITEQRIKRSAQPEAPILVPITPLEPIPVPETPTPPHETPTPPHETPTPAPPPEVPKPREEPSEEPKRPNIEPKSDPAPKEPPAPQPEAEPELKPVRKVETKPIHVDNQSDRVVEEEQRKGQYLIPLDQARPLKRITGFTEKEKRAALRELADYLHLTNSDLKNGIERRPQSWAELHVRIRKFKIARQRMYAEGLLTTEDTKDVFELTFPVAWSIIELFRDELEKGFTITNAVNAIRYAHQAGLFVTDVTWDNRTVGWRMGVLIGHALRRQFNRSGDTLPAGHTAIANRFFTAVSHLETEAHEPLRFNVRTFLQQNKELARFARSLIYSYKSSLEDAMIPKERGAAAVRMLAAKFIDYGLVSEKDVSTFAKNYLPREPESTTDHVFNALPWQVRQALWWVYEQWARIRG